MTSTTLTIAKIINGMTSSDFSSSDIDINQEVAYNTALALLGDITIAYTGILSDNTFKVTDPQQAISIAMFATAILREGRRDNRSRTEIITVRTADKLFTMEMRNMLLIGDSADEDTVEEGMMWTNEQPTGSWDETGSIRNL